MNSSLCLCSIWIQNLFEVVPTGCKTVSAFIEKAQKKFSPKLDSFPLCDITLHRYTAGLKISELLKQSGFENIDLTPLPLLIRYANALLPVAKKQSCLWDSHKLC